MELLILVCREGEKRLESKERMVQIRRFSVEGVMIYGRLSRAERYVDNKMVIDAERVQPVMVALDGKVLSWYQ